MDISDGSGQSALRPPTDSSTSFRLDGPRAVGSLLFVDGGDVHVQTADAIGNSAVPHSPADSETIAAYEYQIQQRDGAGLTRVGNLVWAPVVVDGQPTLASTVNIGCTLTDSDANAVADFVVQHLRYVSAQSETSPTTVTISTSNRGLATALSMLDDVVALKSTNLDLVNPSRRVMLEALETTVSALSKIQHDPTLVAELAHLVTAILAPTLRQTPKINVDYSAQQLATNITNAERRLHQQLTRVRAAEYAQQALGGPSHGFELRHL